MTIRALVIFFAPVLLAGCLIAPEDATCNIQPNCESCLATSGCGWCPSFGCVDGTSLGPESGNCTGYTFTQCVPVVVDPCETPTSCDACARAGCVWCTGGSGLGCGNGLDCLAEYEVRDPGMCTAVPPPSCSDHYDCTSCVNDPSCSWHESTTTEYNVYCDAYSCTYAYYSGSCQEYDAYYSCTY